MAVCSLRFRLPTFVLLGLTAGSLLLTAAPAPAQHFRKITNPPDLLDMNRRVYDMKDGKASAKVPENKVALDALTRILAYRMTYPQALTLGTKGPGDPVNAKVDGVDIKAIYLAPREALTYLKPMPAVGKFNALEMEYVNEFGKLLTDRLKEVLTNPEPIVRVNAAQMLGMIGRTGYEGVADTYLDILKKNEGDIDADAIKFFALKGLKDLLAIPNPADPARSLIADPAQERKVARALSDFILRKPPLSAGASKEELDAVSYVRREAVRALANIHQPVLRAAGTIDSMPLLTLLKVAVADPGVMPRPSPSEQAEAVLGICRMADEVTVNHDYLAHALASAFHDLAIHRKNDDTVLPWTAYGTKLERALAAFREQTQSLPKSRGADKLLAVIDRATNNVAKPIAGGAQTKNAISTDELDSWRNATPPVSASLVRDDPKATVSPRLIDVQNKPDEPETPKKP
jgi:hypothetical protein